MASRTRPAEVEEPLAPREAPELSSGERLPGDRPNVVQVRKQVAAELLQRSNVTGLIVFAAAASLYAGLFYGALAAPWWPLQIACGIAAGFLIGTLFIVAHDACHGGLTPSNGLNGLIGRIGFLPSLTPYVSWEYAHNRIHHSYTNLRPRDTAWAPFTKDEYDRLSPLRQKLERHYRTFWGMGSYYLLEYWTKRLLFPTKAERREMGRPKTFLFDWALIALFAVVQIGGVVAFAMSRSAEPGFLSGFTSPVALLITAVVIPFNVWSWVMGFAIYQHHNHPRLAWFADRNEWDFFAAQVESTVHIRLPKIFEWVSANIMQHTAHHVNPKISLYHLPASQACLEEAYPRDIIIERWSVNKMFRTLALCKLYDYDNHRWLNFDGRGMTEPNPVLRRLRERQPPVPRLPK